MQSIASRLGAEKLLTPREVTRTFLDILDAMYENTELSFAEIMNDPAFEVHSADKDPEQLDESEDLFAGFDI